MKRSFTTEATRIMTEKKHLPTSPLTELSEESHYFSSNTFL